MSLFFVSTPFQRLGQKKYKILLVFWRMVELGNLLSIFTDLYCCFCNELSDQKKFTQLRNSKTKGTYLCTSNQRNYLITPNVKVIYFELSLPNKPNLQSYNYVSLVTSKVHILRTQYLKFRYSEKATKICPILKFDATK